MRLQDMRLLVRVADTGSMTEAARQLHLTPAAVSGAVRRNEAELELRLFERTTRSLHPTDEGLVVLEGCRRVLRQWRETLEQARAQHTDLSGTVHLSAPSDTAYSVLGAVVADLCVAHPRLRVELDISDALQHLHRDAIDIAIRYGRLEDSTLVAHRLIIQPNLLVASPAYLAQAGRLERIEDLEHHRLLTLRRAGRASMRWAMEGPDGAKTWSVHSPICADGHQVRLWAVAGVGIAMKNLVDVIDDLEAGRLVRALDHVSGGDLPVHAVFPSREGQSERVRALHAAIAARFASLEERCEAWLRR